MPTGAKNVNNVRVYGDLSSEVYLAPKGTVLPTTLADLPAAWQVLGWVSDDGVNLGLSTDVEKFKGWQGGATLRTKVTSVEKSFSLTALEETPLVTSLYYGHGAPVISGTGADRVARIDLPEGFGTIERAAVIKFTDAGVTKFFCCENAQVSDRGESPHSNSEITAYEMTFDVVGASFLLTNAPAYLGV